MNYIYLFPAFGPVVDLNSGVYNNKIVVNVSNFIPHSEMRYTLNGDAPSKSSELLDSPISIDKTTSLRIKTFRNNNEIGREVVRSYIIIDRKISLPIVNLILDNKDLFDQEIGIYSNNNINKRGEMWQKAGYFVYSSNHTNLTEPQFHEPVKIRIFGNKSREFPRKSFHICFIDSNQYKPYLDSKINNYNCLILRNSGNDFNSTLFKDALVHSIVADNSVIHTQNYRPVVLYLNNDYFGIYNLREDINVNLLSQKYGGLERDYTILFPERSWGGKVNRESGTKNDDEDYYRLLLLANNFKDKRQDFEKLIDIDNFLDYHIFQTFINNYDYKTLNQKIYRYNGFIKYPGTERDGKFRWLLYDTDLGFGSIERDVNIFDYMLGTFSSKNEKWSYVLFKEITKDIEYKEKFIDRYTFLLNTSLRPKAIIHRIDYFSNNLRMEMPYHIRRWDNWENFVYFDRKGIQVKPLKSIADWENEINKLKVFAEKRNSTVFDELNEVYKLGGVIDISVENPTPEMGYVKINGIEIMDSSWIGKFFNYQTITAEAIPYEGYEFLDWEITSPKLKKPIFKKL